MSPRGGSANMGVTDPDATGANRVNNTSTIIIDESGPCLLGGQGEPILGITPIIDSGCGDTNGVNEVDLSTIKLYPNPTEGMIRIDYVSGFSGYAVLNHLGQIIQQGNFNSDFLSLDLKQCASGSYILMLTNDSQFGYVKIMKI